jgi:hypothetical protein
MSPFSHATALHSRAGTLLQPGTLETQVECIPRLRQWGRSFEQQTRRICCCLIPALTPVMCRMAARSRKGPLAGGWGWELQEFCQRCGTGPMHGRAHRHLNRFQIQAARLAAVIKDDAQQVIYFARDFLADRFGRSISWANRTGSSTGRKRQICSLTSRSWPPSSRK